MTTLPLAVTTPPLTVPAAPAAPAALAALSPFPPELPFSDPILVFATAVIVFLVAPLLLERFRLPGIVGIILVGAAIGPNALGLMERGEAVVLLGQVGIVYLMFLAGLEIDLGEFRENRAESVEFGFLSFLVPQAVGTVVGVYVLGFDLLVALLFASVFASHTLLAYPVVNRLGIGDNRAVTTAIGGTILTDTLALLVLAVVVGAHLGELTLGFWATLGGGLALFFVGTWTLVPRLGRWFFRTVDEESYFEFLFVVGVAFVAAYAAEVAGVEGIIGAFLAGLALNSQIPTHGVLMNRIEFVGNALFIPFFLLSVGMLVDPFAVFAGPETVVVAGALVAMTVATKAGAAALAGWRFDYTVPETAAVFGLSVGQAAAALAVTLVGFEIGLFGATIVNAVVLMILVISILAPSVVGRYGKAIAVAEADAAYEPGGEPERVLVPLTHDSRNAETLVDVALLLRDPTDGTPIYTVTVVPPGERAETAAAVADAETDSAAVASYAAGAEVPVESGTRINHHVASGIANAAAENRVTTILMGWDGARSRRQSTIGTVIDGVLLATEQLVVVSRVDRPLSTTDRVVLLLPPSIDHNDGFYEAINAIKRIADGLDAGIVAYAIDGNPDQYRTLLEVVTPETPVEVRDAGGWDGALEVLQREVTGDDLTVLLSSRRGRVGWHPKLQTLPKSVSTLVDGNFAVVYPPVESSRDERKFLKLGR